MSNRWKRLLAAAAILPLLLCAGGCWDDYELDAIAIVTGVGIDAGQEPDEINLSVQVGKMGQNDPSQSQKNSNKSEARLLSATGRSIFSTFELLKSESSRKLLLHHNQVLLIGREQARRGVRAYLDFFLRNYGSRMEVWVLVADGKAQEILSSNVEQDPISAIGIAQILENETKISKALGINILQFINSLLAKTTAPAAPVITVRGAGEKSELMLDGMAVFRQDKMVGQLDPTQTKGYIWVAGALKDGVIQVPTELGLAVLKVISSECSVRPILREDGGADIALKITAQLSVAEMQGFEDAGIEQVSALLEQGAAEQIRGQVLSCFAATQQLNADIYGFGETIHRKYPKQWKEMEQRWDTIYPTIRLQTEIHTMIKDAGQISDSLAKGEKNQ